MGMITSHDVLTAWRDGRIPYRDAFARTGVESLGELYEAAHDGGVPIRTTFTAEEVAAGEATAALVTGQASARTSRARSTPSSPTPAR